MENILVIEDTPSLREVLCTVLSCEGYKVTGVASAEEGLTELDQEDFTLVLSDLKLPGMSGIDFLDTAKKKQSSLPVIVMTAYGSIDIAVEAMKKGATDFITKPFDPSMLCGMLKQVSEHRRIVNRSLLGRNVQPKRLLTQSPKMELLINQMRKVAPLSSTVLVVGESGTGKELIAQAIHELSPRVNEPFVGVNCGSMPSELLESEFFGHEQGSFTGATEPRIGLFEVASNGTLFLDEIGNMPPNLQIKLLRTLQESEIKPLGSNKVRKVNTRVVSATNCNLEEEIKQGRFREDLYYRLGVVILEVPPLRERPEDIELLANYFMKRHAVDSDKSVAHFQPDALKLLQSYDWPGNVRELENVIERAMIFSDGEISADSIELTPPSNGVEESARALQEIAAEAAKSAEIQAITRALAQTRGNKTKAARLLGVSYKTLLNKVKDYGINEKSAQDN